MPNAQDRFNAIIELLNTAKAAYKLFHHRPVYSYEDAALAQEETGFVGTEGKCLVLKTDSTFIVFTTLQGKKVDFKVIAETVGAQKVKLCSAEELQQYFQAEPGCAYPFGFDEGIPIYVDPQIFEQEWFLFSPAIPTATIQIKGTDLKKVFSTLKNPVALVDTFTV